MFYIIGLGNPGQEYDNTRHNTGRMVAAIFAKQNGLSDFTFSKISNAEISEGKIGKEKVTVILPNTFMNKSGEALRKIKDLKIKTVNKIKVIPNLVVIHDELDVPFGKLKVSFNKSSGGHRGVESVIKAVKSEGFVRIRMGICPTTSGGKMKKPHGEDAVGDFILAKFKTVEETELKKILKSAGEAVKAVITEGKEKGMGKYNSLYTIPK